MFGNWFSKKYSIAESGILDGVTDIHTHLLPEVDDGMKDQFSAQEAIAYLEGKGVSRIFVTPHVMTDFPDNTFDALSGKFGVFQGGTDSAVSFRLCAEYMLDTDFGKHLADRLLTYDGEHVLLETSYMAPPPGLYEMLEEVMSKGYIPIIAHPERYVYMELPDYQELESLGCLFQMNLMSSGGMYGGHARHFAKELLEKGFYTFVGSDIHRTSVYDEFLNERHFTRKQLEQIEALFANNASLWR